MFGEWDKRALNFSRVSPMKTQVLKAFAGETKPLRCIQSRQHENIGWFLSETSPFSKETLTQGLVQVPEESTCYRIYQTTQNVTVNILEVLVQKETIGFFTCAEETSLYTHTNRRVWSVLDVYLITMFEPAVEIINVTLHSLAETCKQAMALLNEENSISKVPYLELRHPLISYSWGRIICEARSVNNYQCYQPTGRDGQSVPNDQALWKGTQKAGYLKLQKDKYLLIPGSISGGYMRIRLNGVSIYSTGSVWFELVTHRTSPGTVSAILKDPEHNQYIVFETKTLSSLATVILSKDKVCAEAWQTASSSDYFVTFDYIILEPLLSYMEFPGGIRIPFKHALDPVDFSEIRGLRIWASPKTVLSIIHKEQTIDSIYYETPTRPEHLLERMIPRGPLPEPTVSHSECDQNYAKTRHIASYCHNLPPTCFEDGKKERMYTITLLRDISDLPISIEPASSLVTVESLLRVSEFEGPFYEILFVVKQVGGTSTNYIPILRILWDRKRIRLITLDNGPKSELTLPLPGSTSEIQQSRMDILLSQAMRNISVAFRLDSARRVADTAFISPPVSGSIELMYRTHKQTTCMECYMCINVENRGAYLASTEAIRRRWARTKRSPLHVEINRNNVPYFVERQEKESFHALRWLQIHNSMWPNYTNIPSARIIERLQYYNAQRGVTVRVHNTWHECPPGSYLALTQPPSCLPCPPNTRSTMFWQGDRQPNGRVCVPCEYDRYQLNPGRLTCLDCEVHFDLIEGVEYCGRRSSQMQPFPQPAWPRTTPRPKAGSLLPTEDQIRRSSVPTYGAIFWMFTCLMGLLTMVVYFYLEATGFTLSKIARGKLRRRPPPRKKRAKQQYLSEMAVFRDIPIQTEESWVCSHGWRQVQQDLILLRDIGIQTDATVGKHEKSGKEVEETNSGSEATADAKSDKASGRAETVSRSSQTRFTKKGR